MFKFLTGLNSRQRISNFSFSLVYTNNIINKIRGGNYGREFNFLRLERESNLNINFVSERYVYGIDSGLAFEEQLSITNSGNDLRNKSSLYSALGRAYRLGYRVVSTAVSRNGLLNSETKYDNENECAKFVFEKNPFRCLSILPLKFTQKSSVFSVDKIAKVGVIGFFIKKRSELSD